MGYPRGGGQLHSQLQTHPPFSFGEIKLTFVTMLSQRVTKTLQFLVDLVNAKKHSKPYKGLLKNAKIRKVLVAVQGLEPRTRGL